MLPFIKCFLDKIFGDGTSFENLDVNTITRGGYESYGNEIMYNGLLPCRKKQ